MKSKYKTDAGDILLIEVRPETLTLSLSGIFNLAPTSGITIEQFAIATSSRFRHGVNARRVRIQFPTPPSGYAPGAVIALPWLDFGTWAAAKAATTGQYKGVAINVLAFVEEHIG